MVCTCLLCLNTIGNQVDSIGTDTTTWKDLDIAKKLEKHFWSLTTIQPNSYICLSCWEEVNSFHKFYLRIEEAHMHFYKIKNEDIIESKEGIITQVSEIDIGDESNNNRSNINYSFLEPEIQIHQLDTRDIIDPGNVIDKDLTMEKCLNNMPLKQACKRRRPQKDTTRKRGKIQDKIIKDPLAKSKRLCNDKPKENKNSKIKTVKTEEPLEDSKLNALKVKEEPLDLDDNNSDSGDENDNEETDGNYLPDEDQSANGINKVRKSNSKLRATREEHDNFIAEHFKQMFCDLCQIPLKNFPDMQKHFLDTHQQQGYFVCCERKYFYRRLLIDHIHSHLNPDHFKCNQCGKVLSDRLRLEKHVLWVHGTKHAGCCDECGKSFAGAHILRLHKLTHLSEEEKKFPCEECGKFYGSSYLLHCHVQAVHLKKFVKICHICGKFISCSSDYKIHMNKHEGIPQPVIHCDVCGLRLTTERGLKRHKDTQHPVDGKKEHCCSICYKVSPTLKALRKHISTMHVQGYDHKCTICEKAFKRAETLKEHMASHTGTPLYTCSWCPKTFNSNGNMHAHRKKMHPKEWEEAKLQKYSGNLKPNIISTN